MRSVAGNAAEVPAVVEELVQGVRARSSAGKQKLGNLSLVEHDKVEQDCTNGEGDPPHEALVRADRYCPELKCARQSHGRSLSKGLQAVKMTP